MDNKCYFLFIILMVMTFLPNALAPWTWDKPPKVPDDDAAMNCAEWIYFFGFDAENYDLNSELANTRTSFLDMTASIWAVRYAYVISGPSINKHKILPHEFCNTHGMFKEIVLLFSPLRDERRTCEDWIYFYGYTRSSNALNWDKAKGRNLAMDGDISMWAAIYGEVLTEAAKKEAISPLEFCFLIGKTSIPMMPMPFMTLNETVLTCEDWIKLFEYTDNTERNYVKARRDLPLPRMLLHVQYWAREYTTRLFFMPVNEAVIPQVYCESRGQDANTRNYYVPRLL